jgi:hypothetical protein
VGGDPWRARGRNGKTPAVPRMANKPDGRDPRAQRTGGRVLSWTVRQSRTSHRSGIPRRIPRYGATSNTNSSRDFVEPGLLPYVNYREVSKRSATPTPIRRRTSKTGTGIDGPEGQGTGRAAREPPPLKRWASFNRPSGTACQESRSSLTFWRNIATSNGFGMKFLLSSRKTLA